MAYLEHKGKKKTDDTPKARTKGFSRHGRQKRHIADMTEGMRLDLLKHKRKPLIFVLTTPGFLDHANEPRFLKRFIDNLRTNYGLKSYLWVREFTANGYPHFHFIAQCDDKKVIASVVQLSELWSSYFGETARNSIRLGTKPTWNGNRWIRKMFVNGPKMARYLSKYIGKSVGGSESRSVQRKPKGYNHSEEISGATVPVIYHDALVALWNGKHERVWNIQDSSPDWLELSQFDPRAYQWKQIQGHFIFFGHP